MMIVANNNEIKSKEKKNIFRKVVLKKLHKKYWTNIKARDISKF